MLDRALLNKTIRQIPDIKGLANYGARGDVDCYRSRVPFLNSEEVNTISLLLNLCVHDYSDWTTISRLEGNLYQRTTLYVKGVCTDRAVTTVNVASIIENYTNRSTYGTQVVLVNVTNHAQYPAILEYIRTNNLSVVTTATTQYAGRPVEYIGVRINHTQEEGYDYPIAQYIIFTTLWDYHLNLSLIYTALHHMLLTTTENPECDRLVKFRPGYGWFKKYFEGQDVTPIIIEYFRKEFLDKLDELRRTALVKSLEGFSESKVSINEDISRQLRQYREAIKSLENQIADYYAIIRKVTMDKLITNENINLLETAIKIFQGMLEKGMLSGFNYYAHNGTLKRFSWRVRIPITYWEPDEAKYWLNTYNENRYKHDLFKALFIDEVVTSWCEQYMTIDLENGGRPSHNNDDGTNDDAIYPHNPHIGRYNCFGNNESEVKRAINNKDIATAITICMNACMQLNMTDHTVTSYWMNQCDYRSTGFSSMAFLEYRGNMYTPAQLYELYKKEGGFNNGKETEVDQQTEEADA